MSQTLIRRPFAGQERSFDLRIGEITALERACVCGIYGLVSRIAGHQAYAADIRETIRLGLVGGGMSDAESTRLVMASCDGYPLSQHLPLAAEIIQSVVDGLPVMEQPDADDDAKKAMPETLNQASPAGTAQAS
jgi:hypothetical protein